MRIHIALYRWKDAVAPEQIEDVYKRLTSLGLKIPGIIGITCTKNESKYSEGYTHVIYVRGRDQVAIDTYLNHPQHTKLAKIIDTMEERGVGVDFTIPSN
jgi:heme-degrading monooxygenase HmoA